MDFNMLQKMPINVNPNTQTHTSMSVATSSRVSPNPRLNDNDARAVDFLLDIDSSACNELASPLSSGSFMERVQAAQRLLCRLDNLPTEEPPPDLVQATLQKVLPAAASVNAPPPSGIHA